MADEREKKPDRHTRVRPHPVRTPRRGSTQHTEEAEPPARERGNVADFATARRRRQRRGWRRVLLRLAAVAVVLTVAAAVAMNWETLRPAGLIDSVTGLFSGRAGGDGFPVPISSDTVVDMTAVDDRLAVLTDTALLWLNNKGGETDRRLHTFAHPAMRTAGSYALLADIGGRRLRLETARETQRTWEAAGEIAALDVTAQGMTAVVTAAASRSYLSEAVVLDKKGEERFHWYSAEWLLTGVALRGDGGQVAVTGIAASGGAMRAALMIFNLTDKTPAATFEGGELLPLEVRYYTAGGLVMVGDRAAWSVTADLKTRAVADYADLELLRYAIGGADTALALRHVGRSDGGELRLLDAKGEAAGTATFAGRLQDVEPAAGGGCWLLAEGKLLRLKGGKVSERAVPADSLRVAVFQKKLALLGLTEMRLTEG